MKQIRVVKVGDVETAMGPQFTCEWMEGCAMNRWLLRARLAEALATHGPSSYALETREKVRRSDAVAA